MMINTRLASYVILKRENKILMTQRLNTGFEDGNFSFPSGKLEENESFIECAKREALEEIGIILKNLSPVHVIHRKKNDKDIWIDVFFLSDAWEGELKNMEPHKCSKIDWFSIDNLPKNTIPFVREVIGQLKNDKFYTEIGWDNYT